MFRVRGGLKAQRTKQKQRTKHEKGMICKRSQGINNVSMCQYAGDDNNNNNIHHNEPTRGERAGRKGYEGGKNKEARRQAIDWLSGDAVSFEVSTNAQTEQRFDRLFCGRQRRGPRVKSRLSKSRLRSGCWCWVVCWMNCADGCVWGFVGASEEEGR